MSVNNRTVSGSSPRAASWLCFVALIAGTLVQTGCLGLASNLMHAVGADMIPAEYEGLEKAKVAVVSITQGSQYLTDVTAQELNQRLAAVLSEHVDDISLVRPGKIARWRDENGYDAIDFRDIGKGVGADKVLGVEVHNLQLRDGPTLYRGRSNVSLQVIDVATGTIEYRRNLDEFTFPTIAGQYTSETTESRFRKLYLQMLAEEICRSFYAYDFSDRLAQDSAIAGQ